jgi:hypothetical protein
MKKKDLRENSDLFSGQLSRNVRQLSFAGFAIIWLFSRSTGPVNIEIPQHLWFAGCLFTMALSCDFLQYFYGAVAWNTLHAVKEWQDVSEATEFTAPSAINWPTNCFFLGKVLCAGIGYWLVLRFFFENISL